LSLFSIDHLRLMKCKGRYLLPSARGWQWCC